MWVSSEIVYGYSTTLSLNIYIHAYVHWAFQWNGALFKHNYSKRTSNKRGQDLESNPERPRSTRLIYRYANNHITSLWCISSLLYFCKMFPSLRPQLRTQAEAELRTLRTDLTQKKINLSLNRPQLAALASGHDSFSPRSPMITNRAWPRCDLCLPRRSRPVTLFLGR